VRWKKLGRTALKEAIVNEEGINVAQKINGRDPRKSARVKKKREAQGKPRNTKGRKKKGRNSDIVCNKRGNKRIRLPKLKKN